MKVVSLLISEFQSVIFLTCGALLIVTLNMPWIKATLLSLMGMRIGLDANGWDIINGEMSWIGSIGPLLVLISGILMVICALVALILPRITDDAGELLEYIGKGVRVIPFVAILGVVVFYFDAKDFSDCGTIPDEWIGYAVWVVGVIAIIGAIVGITLRKPVILTSSSDVTPFSGAGKVPVSRRSIKRELLERDEETVQAVAQAVEETVSAKEYFDRAVDYVGQGEIEQAINAYSKAIEADTNYALAYFNRGAIYGSEGRTEEALADFQRVVELSEDPDLLNITRKRIEKLAESD